MGTKCRASGALIDPLRHVPANERLREPFKAGRKAASGLALRLRDRQPDSFTTEDAATVAPERPATSSSLAGVLDTSNVA
jgi:hypothetical protein